MTTDAPVVILRGQPYTLVKPRPVHVQILGVDLAGAPVGQWLGTVAAALRMCWPPGVAWPARIPPPDYKLSHRVEDWGAGIYDGLVAAGLSEEEIIGAAAAARAFAIGLQVTQAEVTAAKGFSEPPAETPPAGG
jgi:hypothetical protein